MTHVRTMRVPWSMLAEDEQRDIIYAITSTSTDMVRRAAHAIAHRGFPHVEVTIGKTTLDKGIEMKVCASNTLDNVMKIADHGKIGAVLVLAEVSDFFGERAAAEPDPQEPGLPLETDEE